MMILLSKTVRYPVQFSFKHGMVIRNSNAQKRQRETERDRERQRDRETEREKLRDRERQREKLRDRERN